MKQAVLYICHGSRVEKARAEAVSFISKCMESVDAPIQEICFLELSEPDILSGFEACIKKGAESIAAVPVLLLTAAHAKLDIPEELEKAGALYPEIPVTYGKPIGVQGDMAEAVLEQLRPLPKDEDVRVLLTGRGSSDPDVKRDLGIIAKGIAERAEGVNISPCYLTAAEPSFSDMLSRIDDFPEKNIYIVPYLLFTGLLMKGIEKEASQLTTRKNMTVCSYVGFSMYAEKAFLRRVNETLSALSEKPEAEAK
ncbi:sirohydrochlorin chelatase [Metabacillus sp. 84]|uniref:sirohydrochlorin chelatase n=1 Tax=unclassified Metabacillus TaxID=2675274 RepID=UPI003CE75A50